MYWRRFAVSSIPLADTAAFDVWLRDRWAEKDDLLEHFQQHGRFPASEDAVDPDIPSSVVKDGIIETEVKSSSRFEFLLMFAPLVVLGVVVALVRRVLMG